MDSLLQMNENKNDGLHLLMEDQIREMERENRDRLMFSDRFSIERLENDEMAADSEQIRKMREYQEKQDWYDSKKDELEQGAVTPKGEIEYQHHLIQAEQNRMRMRLMKAAILDRQGAAKQVKAEGLAKIISFRQKILERCAVESIPWCFHKKQLEREKAEYDRITDELNLDALTTAALDRVKMEREAVGNQNAEDEAGMIQEFLDTDFSEQALRAEYVIQNLDTCLHNVELLRRIEAIRLAQHEEPRPVNYIFMERKFEAVREYTNVVESVLWEYGMTIDDTALQVRKIDENDEDFAARRQAYQKNGALRFALGARKYRRAGEGAGAVPNGQQAAPTPTRIEERLSVLEEMLGIQGYGDDMKIMVHMRDVGKSSHVNPGDEIRASDEQAQGRMEDRLIKLRISSIYQHMIGKIEEQFPEDKEAFQSLEESVAKYVCTNRKPYESRGDMEKEETAAFAALKAALMAMRDNGENLCSSYADLLLGVITEESNGYLDVPPDQVHPVEDRNIVLGNKGFFSPSIMRTYIDCTRMPLFTHRPNIKDIEQGGLGDCYLLAGLVSLVEQNAEEVMNIMKDNGDGTVTVRFIEVKTDGSGNTSYIPHYVTVKKTIPVYRWDDDNAYSRGAFWIKMMEKAYAASGFHILEKVNRERARRGTAAQTAEELEESIAQGNQRVNYRDIEGGMTSRFIGLLLGKENEVQYLDKNRADVGADRIGRLLPAINEPEWDRDPARRYGNDSADSIVYEYIKKVRESLDQKSDQKPDQESERIPKLEDTFLHLRKPTGDGPEKAAYERQRKSIQFFVRNCMLQLDVIDTLIRETKTDILGMKSEEEIENWYKKLIQLFEHYKSHIDSWRLLRSNEDEIIADVRKNYYRDEIRTFFDAISKEDFQVTVDILKERHLALFRRNQQIAQGAGNENFEQFQRGYYTYRDYKLYERISKRLGAGAYIAFGTRKLSDQRTGRNGESEAGGMVGTHAYAIINTCSKIIGGEERLFFVIMNPWATKGVVYGVDVDELKKRAVRGKNDGEKEEGIFLLELKDFAELVTHWDSVSA